MEKNDELVKLLLREVSLFYNLLSAEVERQSVEERKSFGYGEIADKILELSKIDDQTGVSNDAVGHEFISRSFASYDAKLHEV